MKQHRATVMLIPELQRNSRMSQTALLTEDVAKTRIHRWPVASRNRLADISTQCSMNDMKANGRKTSKLLLMALVCICRHSGL